MTRSALVDVSLKTVRRAAKSTWSLPTLLQLMLPAKAAASTHLAAIPAVTESFGLIGAKDSHAASGTREGGLTAGVASAERGPCTPLKLL